MKSLVFTLLSDGSSDRALLPVLDWLLQQHSNRTFQAQWADLRGLRHPPKSLSDRISTALELYPCDILFIHRDAERQSRDVRTTEIRQHLRTFPKQVAVCVIPVRMQEAWFVFDEAALRHAADNPQGRIPLDLPPLDRLEEIPDPKELICQLLEKASGLRPGRLKKFRPATRILRIASLIENFAPLRRLPAFQALEDDLQAILTGRAWS